MSLNSCISDIRSGPVRLLILVAAVGLVAILIWLAPPFVGHMQVVHAASLCEERPNDAEKVACWMQMVAEELRAGGMKPAYAIFSYLYEAYPAFGATGCHQHAHAIGDVAYYEVYVAQGKTLQDMDFPQETTSCGYGFFHGFIEHLIQDHPDQAYVVETCEYLRERLSGTMRDIGTICYHASGHGFMQSQADTLGVDGFGNALRLVEAPLRSCDALPTNAKEIQDCREGVFNVLADWQIIEDFGLTFDFTDPFYLCERVASKWRKACYYELGMKLEPVIGDSPLKAAEYVSQITDRDIRIMTFGVMVAGMMQRRAPLDTYTPIIDECMEVEDSDLFTHCIVSSANGMMEHGSPGKEYEKVLTLCRIPGLEARGGQESCYRALAHRLSRFYPEQKKVAICSEFPEKYRNICSAES